MTAPRDPDEIDPADPPASDAPRQGARHAAPDDDPADDRPAGAVAGPDDRDAADDQPAADAEAGPDAGDPADGQHPADDESAALDPSPVGATESSDAGFGGAVDPDDPLLAQTGAPEPTADSSTTSSAATGATPPARRRHAAQGSSLRLPGWMIWLASTVVIVLIAWLVISLATGDDEQDQGTSSATATETATTSAAPTPVDVNSLPQLLCTGNSYLTIETGLSPEQLLADPASVEAQYPGSQLSTIPPGCIADTDTRDEVVLAMGPYPSIEDACTAGSELQGVQFTAYAGSASEGLSETSCSDSSSSVPTSD